MSPTAGRQDRQKRVLLLGPTCTDVSHTQELTPSSDGCTIDRPSAKTLLLMVSSSSSLLPLLKPPRLLGEETGDETETLAEIGLRVS